MSKFLKPKSEEQFIKGTKTPKKPEFSRQAEPMFTLSLRLQKFLVNEIDEILITKKGISRCGWIIQAIQDKLKKEKE